MPDKEQTKKNEFDLKGFITLGSEVVWGTTYRDADKQYKTFTLSALEGTAVVKAASVPKPVRGKVQRALRFGLLKRVSKEKDVNIAAPQKTEPKDIKPETKGDFDLGDAAVRAEYTALEDPKVKNNELIPDAASFHNKSMDVKGKEEAFELMKNTGNTALKKLKDKIAAMKKEPDIARLLSDVLYIEKRGYNGKGGPRISIVDWCNEWLMENGYKTGSVGTVEVVDDTAPENIVKIEE